MFLFASIASAPVAFAEGPKLPAPIEEVLQWFPVDTESLLVTQGPHRLTPPMDRGGDLCHVVQAHSSWLIGQFLDETIGKKLSEQEVTLAVEGGRRFTAPKGGGIMHFEGCQVLRFDERSNETLRKAYRECAETADSIVLLAGKKVAIFKKTEKERKDEWNLYLALPRNGVLLCATDREYLKVLLERMERNAEKRALPQELLEWQHVDLEAPIWAIRHFSRKTAADDPSSPFREKAFTFTNLPDAKAIGITYSVERESKAARVRYLSRAANARELAVERWNRPQEGLTSVVTPITPTGVEIKSEYQTEEGQYMLFLRLLGAVGHGVE